MAAIPATLLIVDDDLEAAETLRSEADSRGYRTSIVPSVLEAIGLLESGSFDAVLVDPAPAGDAAFELLGRLKDRAGDTEVLVMSNRASVAPTIQWFDPDAFAFVRKTDPIQVFAAVARAVERRRITAQNRRLVWELQTINDIASGISASLELEDVLTGALQRLVRVMDAAGGAIRLRDDFTGIFHTRAAIGADRLRWDLSGEWVGVTRPSDEVIATRAAVIVEDFAELACDGTASSILLRSAISVPMLAGSHLLGTVSLGATTPGRFTVADQQLLAIIAGQIAVAVQNAQLHESIRRAKREWERTFDAISEPIAVFNDRGELLRGNKALAVHLDRPITTIRRLSCRQVGFCGGGQTCAACAVTRALQQEPSRGEVTLRDGQIFSVTTFPIDVPSEGPSVVQVAKNVTDEIRSARKLQQMSSELASANAGLVAALDQLKSTQAQLVQAEKLSAIGQLVAGVAHELNNPLTSVIGYAQLLEEELRLEPGVRPAAEVSEDLRRIAEESERAARIIRNLLAFARKQSAERQPQDIADLCSRVLALRQYEFRMSGVDVQVRLASTLPPVVADGGQLQQVLLNLVLNAEHAMRGRPDRRLSVAASYDEDAGAVRLIVSDSGEGIDRANLSRIFDPFFTTREVGQGTGLGLSICYGIVRDHGGHIDVESTPGVGSTFTVILPARCESSSSVSAEVLVAHAAQAEREFIAAALSAWGYAPVLASTVREAFDAWRRPALQLAIIDRGLLAEDPAAWREQPHARDGFPIVITSRTPDDQAHEWLGSEGTRHVLVQPIELRALRSAVRGSVKECV